MADTGYGTTCSIHDHIVNFFIKSRSIFILAREEVKPIYRSTTVNEENRISNTYKAVGYRTKAA